MARRSVDLSGIDVPTDAPVLVTGATGYVAGWVVKALLDAGVTVHAAVRDPDASARVAHLVAMADAAPGELKLFAADLLTPGAYTEAMRGCRVVIHTASPFTRAVADPQRDLVDPAVLGTRSVLESASATPSVERVVLTSSIAAVYSDAIESERAPHGVLDESLWNTTASLTYEPYLYSKTLAEREAWRIADAQDRWRLVAVNPGMVLGPALNPDPTSDSFTIMKMLGDGTMRFGGVRLPLPAVDVRDVARAHVAAAFLPDASGRYLLCGHDTDTMEMARLLRPRFGRALALPRFALPKPLVWAVGPLVTMQRRYVTRNIGHVLLVDNTRSREGLGVNYRPLWESLEDMAAQMIDRGAFKRR